MGLQAVAGALSTFYTLPTDPFAFQRLNFPLHITEVIHRFASILMITSW